jgi:hypothetical protein
MGSDKQNVFFDKIALMMMATMMMIAMMNVMKRSMKTKTKKMKENTQLVNSKGLFASLFK